MMRKSIQLVALAILAAGCEREGGAPATRAADVEVEVVGGVPPGGGVPAASFDLEATAALVRDGRVKDGKTLEVQLNGHKANNIDADGDGKRDRLQVVEARDGETRTFTVRAIPTSKGRADPDEVAVAVATIDVVAAGAVARVTIEYAPIVVVASPVVIVFDAPIVVDSFCHWVLILDRPIFIGVAYVVIEAPVHYKHKKLKHKKHKKH